MLPQGAPEATNLPTFQKGDEVSLAKGTYEGTLGTFLNFKADDPNWADILEQNSQVRPHPVEWLRHYPEAAHSGAEAMQAPAYECWLARGCPIGSPEVDWLQAEADLKNQAPA
ncbi:MAG: DUF2934 domain-containing protein [Bryobacteraceae bacterium]